MNYRIVIETEASGKKWYYVQEQYLLFFWRYITQINDMSFYAYKVGWETLEEAEGHIKQKIANKHAENQKKIIKREYLNWRNMI